MASDYLLKIDNLQGASTDGRFRGWIEVESFSWGVSQIGVEGGGGGSAARAKFSSLNVAKLTDKASHSLLQACANGKHFSSGILIGRKAGGGQQEYLQIKLTDILVSSFQQAGSPGGDDVPMESLSLNFVKIEFAFQEQGPDGQFEIKQDRF